MSICVDYQHPLPQVYIKSLSKLFPLTEPSFEMVDKYTKGYLAMVPKGSSYGICIFWATRHPENHTYNILAQGMQRNEVQLISESQHERQMKGSSITDKFECVLVGKSNFCALFPVYSYHLAYLRMPLFFASPPPSYSVVNGLLEKAVQLGRTKLHVVTSLEYVKREMSKLDTWANQKWYTAPKCKGHRIHHFERWKKMYELLQQVDVSWNFDGQRSEVFRGVLETASKHA